MRSENLGAMRILKAALAQSCITVATVDDCINFLALCTHGCRSCAAYAHKLVHASLICLWFGLCLPRSHDSDVANRAEVLQWSQSALGAHGMVPSWGKQGCVVLGVELLVADNAMQLVREIARSSISMGRCRKRILWHSAPV